MSFDAAALRAEFPLFANQPAPFHYLDSAATSQIHRGALAAMVAHDTHARANVLRGTYRLAEAADAAYERARRQVADFLHAASPDEVVFTAGTTAALNLVAAAYAERLAPGDEVVISAAEHHSNFVPWQRLGRRSGAVLRVLPLTAAGRLDTAALAAVVTPRCRLVAVTHASNVSGALTDVAAVVAAARRHGARVLLDGAQRVQHGPVDVQAMGVDFYAFSGHKCFGPGGVGVLWGRAEALAELPPPYTGGGMVGRVSLAETTFAEPPRRFEAGTPPIAQAVGLGAVLTWMRALPWAQIHAHENALAGRLIEGLARLPGVRLIGPADLERRLPIVAFSIAGLHPHDVCQVLDGRGLALRGGHHCAQPLMAHFGIEGASRASIALYNTQADIDALLEGIAAAIRILS